MSAKLFPIVSTHIQIRQLSTDECSIFLLWNLRKSAHKEASISSWEDMACILHLRTLDSSLQALQTQQPWQSLRFRDF